VGSAISSMNWCAAAGKQRQGRGSPDGLNTHNMSRLLRGKRRAGGLCVKRRSRLRTWRDSRMILPRPSRAKLGIAVCFPRTNRPALLTAQQPGEQYCACTIQALCRGPWRLQSLHTIHDGPWRAHEESG